MAPARVHSSPLVIRPGQGAAILARYALVLPLSIHFGGCVGDWWMAAVLNGVPGDTLIEDTPEGFRYRR